MTGGSNWSYAVKGRFYGKQFTRNRAGEIRKYKQLYKSAFRSQVHETLRIAIREENYDELDFTPRRCFTDWEIW